MHGDGARSAKWMDESFVTNVECAGDQIVRGPLWRCVSGGHLKAGGLSRFLCLLSLRPQRK
jgi:hypothetical protein